MSKTILIPTDFSIESLNPVHYAAEANGRINVLLLHGLRLSDSIIDLLFISHNRSILKLTSPDFEAACKMLLDKYKIRLNSLYLDFFSGFTIRDFQNFIDTHKVDEILISKSYRIKSITANSFDLLPFIKSSSYPVKEVYWQPAEGYLFVEQSKRRQEALAFV